MEWDPAHYDNITVMRVLYADIWNPGKNVNVYSVISNNENSFSNFDLNSLAIKIKRYISKQRSRLGKLESMGAIKWEI